MIIDPDFLDHWKTRTLVVALNDEMAPLYLIRLWAHCQLRKTAEFEHLPPHAIKAICRYPGDANELDNLLVTHGFTDRQGDSLIVCGWAEANAYLVNAWANGSRGGRKKSSLENSAKKPVGYPVGIPTGVAEEKRREEKNVLLEKEPKGTKRFVKPTVAEVAAYCREINISVDASEFVDFYESKGWLIGKSPMRDWKATVRRWGKKPNSDRAGPRSKLSSNLDQMNDFIRRHGDETSDESGDSEVRNGDLLFFQPANG
jgi:hypothetical protein